MDTLGYKTKVFGRGDDIVSVETDGVVTEFDCYKAIMKLWFSDGTVLGVKYGNQLCPGIWKIRALTRGKESFMHHHVNNDYYGDYSDVYELDSTLIKHELIPRCKCFE
jgi:hypothetical protein